MSLPSSETPGFEEVLLQFFDFKTEDLHTTMPAIVVAYHPDEQTVDVQPAFKRRYADGVVSLPIIQHVPLVFPSMGGAWLRFPVAPGDEVKLEFGERSLDEWFAQGGQVLPGSTHRFSLTDAIATPGLRSKPNAVGFKGAQTSLEVAFAGAWFEITDGGKFKMTNGVGAVELLDLVDQLITLLKTAPQTDGSTFNPATVAALGIIQTALSSLKA